MIEKFFNNPFFYFQFSIRYISSFYKYPFRVLIFNKIGFFTYISNNSSIRNHRNISVGNFCQINSFVVLWPTFLKIGTNTQINPGTAIYGNVSIGNNVMIAPNCMIAGGNHSYSSLEIPMILQGSNEKGIIIEDDVWIGANSVITDGVTIRKGTIVAAGSVVTKSTEEYSINAGVPSKKINERK